jgi:hypothetical protein
MVMFECRTHLFRFRRAQGMPVGVLKLYGLLPEHLPNKQREERCISNPIYPRLSVNLV